MLYRQAVLVITRQLRCLPGIWITLIAHFMNLTLIIIYKITIYLYNRHICYSFKKYTHLKQFNYYYWYTNNILLEISKTNRLICYSFNKSMLLKLFNYQSWHTDNTLLKVSFHHLHQREQNFKIYHALPRREYRNR